MAERRMFTIKIVDSDAFLDMPLSTQCLYFHLNMRADDDGFVNNPKKIQRMIGACDDDLKLLIAKRFILVFDNGIIVIKHWRMHNTLRKDRFRPTQYQEQLEMLLVKDNNAYTEKSNGNQLATTWQPAGNHLATQYSIVENNIVENNILENSIVDNEIEKINDHHIYSTDKSSDNRLTVDDKSSDIVVSEGDKEKEKEIYKERDSNKEKCTQLTPTIHTFGKYKNVFISDDELEDLKKDYPNEYAEKIEWLSLYMKSTGKSYSSHYTTICVWITRDREKCKKPGNKFGAFKQRDYDYDGIEKIIVEKRLGGT